MIFDQQEFEIRFEWGLNGLEQLVPVSDVVIIVDVLSFSTCVDIATAKGAIVYPYRWKDETAVDYARSLDAQLAAFARTQDMGYSLSPTSLLEIPDGTKLVLPSPNGSTLSLAGGKTPAICGCLRNAEAIARHAMTLGKNISVIAAGEQWENKILRPALEDLLGSGAIISWLKGSLSPESKAALSAFVSMRSNLTNEILKCSSGKELVERGFKNDVYLACDLNISSSVPVLQNNAFVNQAARPNGM